MSLTPSTMLELGTRAPAFSLPDVRTGEIVNLEKFAGRDALLVVFLCAHCPYVIHVRAELARLAREYEPRGAGVVAISSNDIERYPEDSPGSLARFAADAGFSFPVLFDETQDVAAAYAAACTPDFFLFDEQRRLVYRGQLDATRPGKGAPDGRDLRAALEAVLSGGRVTDEQFLSTGCNIKWKPGRGPNS